MLHLIGIGLADDQDISLKGLEVARKCDQVFFETYTSVLQCSLKNLEEAYGVKIKPAGREFVESEEIIEKARDKDVALLIAGDVFSATTHIQLYNKAKAEGVGVKVVNNASVLTAVGITGLELYKFGRTVSIPFHNKNVETPKRIFEQNLKAGLHTLFLLDLDPEKEDYLTIRDAVGYLQKSKSFNDGTLCVACARLGSSDFKIRSGPAGEVAKEDFGKPPYCIIVPGGLHFIEEESLKNWEQSPLT